MNQLPVVVAELVELLDPDLREIYEERAGIIEFDANHPRDHAECLALLYVLKAAPAALLGVSVLEVQRNGAVQIVITTNVELARNDFDASPIETTRATSLAELINTQFGGIAVLTSIA